MAFPVNAATEDLITGREGFKGFDISGIVVI
jgi:hypothetical protein